MRVSLLFLFLTASIFQVNAKDFSLIDKYSDVVRANYYYGSLYGDEYSKVQTGMNIQFDYTVLPFLSLNSSLKTKNLSINPKGSSSSGQTHIKEVITKNIELSAGAGLRKKYLGYVMSNNATEFEVSVVGNVLIDTQNYASVNAYKYNEQTGTRIGGQALGRLKIAALYSKTQFLGIMELDAGVMTYTDTDSVIQASAGFYGPLGKGEITERILLNINWDLNKTAPGLNYVLGIGYKL